MRKILIGTRNDAKFRMVKECMPEIPDVEFVNLNDISAIDDSTLVEGPDFEENAKLKSEFYFKASGIPTIATDNIFWVEKWPKDNGFIVHMRKEANPESPRATDEEVVEFFKKFLDSVGGESKANFFYAIAYTDEKGTNTWVSKQHDYIVQTVQSKNFWPGYPMESLLIDAETGEYKGDQKNERRYSKLIECLATDVKKRILE